MERKGLQSIRSTRRVGLRDKRGLIECTNIRHLVMLAMSKHIHLRKHPRQAAPSIQKTHISANKLLKALELDLGS